MRIRLRIEVGGSPNIEGGRAFRRESQLIHEYHNQCYRLHALCSSKILLHRSAISQHAPKLMNLTLLK